MYLDCYFVWFLGFSRVFRRLVVLFREGGKGVWRDIRSRGRV